MPTDKQQQALRQLPAVHAILHHADLASYKKKLPREWVSQTISDILSLERKAILEEPAPSPRPVEAILSQVKMRLDLLTSSRLRPVINATGIVLHTNLGRAVLSDAATHAVEQTARSYSNLEYNLHTRERGSRHEHVEELLCRLTGAEAAMVVNNNAAAVFLVLRTLARDREVIVSRGQLVEIGGSFRVSEIMRESGSRLVEVGTTNKTRSSDVEKAITPETGMLMKVHTSNFKVIGFTQEVPREELVRLAREHGLICYEDLGSGVLYDLKAHGIGDEPTVQECVQAGVDVLSFSGDKLLGGPQAGIIAGKKEWISRLKKNQLARALRVDKFTLAGLEATLRHYLHPEEAAEKIPTLRKILRKPEEIFRHAEELYGHMREKVPADVEIEILPSTSHIGGGSLPDVELPTHCLAITSSTFSPAELDRRLHQGAIPVIGRISKDRLLLDLRTVEPQELRQIPQLFQDVFS
jgi:L-seryl-tRNA(Ser) seleniumtransferase